MRSDVVVAGVGGQGALSTAHMLADAAHRAGFYVLQGELHGMSQRRGAVQAIVRIADTPIGSPQISEGAATLIVGLEPVEALRSLSLLAIDGQMVVSTHPEPDMAGYPEPEALHAALTAVPGCIRMDANNIAREVGAPKAASVVMLGAAAALVGLPREAVVAIVTEAFAKKGERFLEGELRAMDAGWRAVTGAAAS